MYFLGIDLGTSFIKVSLIDQNQNQVVTVKKPETEMKIISDQAYYCEQNPQEWWKCVCEATQYLAKHYPQQINNLKGIGISYQMHGLVLVDKERKVLRNSIIWADSRTKQIGAHCNQKLKQVNGLMESLLNNPGNFTISKLLWIKEKQPHIWAKVDKFLLPGDFIAMKLTDQTSTTQTGLSEAILWDFRQNCLSKKAMLAVELPIEIVPTVFESFSVQGQVSKRAHQESGIPLGCKVLYRSGDQPNNAFSLNVTEPGQIAASGGTSGTVLVVSDKPESFEYSRLNTFLHVNHLANSQKDPRYAKLLCINSCGISYSWIRKNFCPNNSYEELNKMAQTHSSDGLMVFPFGNGQQRMLNNAETKMNIKNIDLNRHSVDNIVTAVLQSIAFSFVYGLNIIKKSQDPPLQIKSIRVANDNLFNAGILTTIIGELTECYIDSAETTGSVGCAKGAKQCFQMIENDFKGLKLSKKELEFKRLFSVQQSDAKRKEKYLQLYQKWEKELTLQLQG